MKQSMQQRPPRTSLYLNSDDRVALNRIKQFYGMESDARAILQCIREQARQVREPEEVRK